MSRTILLIQLDRPESRVYAYYESVKDCMEAILKIYEEHLKQRNPITTRYSIRYDLSQLFEFVDQLANLSCLVYKKSTMTYAPHNKDWIKDKLYIYLRQPAWKTGANRTGYFCLVTKLPD